MASPLVDMIATYEVNNFDAIEGRLLHDAEGLSQDTVDNFWMPKAALEAGTSRTFLEAFVAVLYSSVMRSRVSSTFAGAEYWVQKYEKGRGLGFHFDKDEYAMKHGREMKQPDQSSIVYLTGSTSTQRQGPTVVLDQRFNGATQCAEPEEPTSSALVFPRRGRFMVFNGELGHGVLDSVSSSMRMTLLINWWSHRPNNVEPLTLATARSLKLDAWQTPGTASETDASKAFASDAVRGGVQQQQADLEAISVERLSDDFPEVQIGALEDPVSVDELLERQRVAVRGEGAHDVIILVHPDLTLYPAADQMEGDKVDCAAFFVPTHAVAEGQLEPDRGSMSSNSHDD